MDKNLSTRNHTFNWEKTKQLSAIQILLAFFLPSLFAFIGFRILLPVIVDKNLPSIIAWPIVASVMLFVLVVVAIILLKKEANKLNISAPARFCLKKLSLKQWGLSIGILIIGLVATTILGNMSALLTKFPGLAVPDYFPFFLNPNLDPMNTAPSILTPGIDIKGAYYLIPLIAVTLLFNILAEELYFRAYLLPKMTSYKHLSWIMNGLLFALYHTFQLWLIPQILPISLFLAFVVYRYKSIWPAFVIHLLTNSMTVVGLIFLIHG